MFHNRMGQLQDDCLLLIVRTPANWRPVRIDEVPGNAEVIASHSVASYAEAYDDLIRCNCLAMDEKLDRWAVIQAPCGGP